MFFLLALNMSFLDFLVEKNKIFLIFGRNVQSLPKGSFVLRGVLWIIFISSYRYYYLTLYLPFVFSLYI